MALSASAGPSIGSIVLAIFALGFVALSWMVARTRSQIKKKAQAAQDALNAGDHAECVRLCDKALATARRMNLRTDDVIAIVLLLRSEGAEKMGKNDEALMAAAQAFKCLCQVKGVRAQLAILDRLGGLLLRVRQERRAILVLEAAVAIGQALDAGDLDNSARLEQLGMANFRVGIHANSAAAFGRAIEIVAKQLGSDAQR